jgi:hypothetical protein
MASSSKSASAPRVEKPSASDTLEASIAAYNAAQPASQQAICERLAAIIQQSLPKASSKVWHGGPVWFLDDNPIVGYWVRKQGTQLLFWSGQSFTEGGLEPEGKFKAAQVKYDDASHIRITALKRWLRQSKSIQWDYKNLPKRRGALEKLGTW